jgi:hypothetical protein
MVFDLNSSSVDLTDGRKRGADLSTAARCCCALDSALLLQNGAAACSLCATGGRACTAFFDLAAGAVMHVLAGPSRTAAGVWGAHSPSPLTGTTKARDAAPAAAGFFGTREVRGWVRGRRSWS